MDDGDTRPVLAGELGRVLDAVEAEVARCSKAGCVLRSGTLNGFMAGESHGAAEGEAVNGGIEGTAALAAARLRVLKAATRELEREVSLYKRQQQGRRAAAAAPNPDDDPAAAGDDGSQASLRDAAERTLLAEAEEALHSAFVGMRLAARLQLHPAQFAAPPLQASPAGDFRAAARAWRAAAGLSVACGDRDGLPLDLSPHNGPHLADDAAALEGGGTHTPGDGCLAALPDDPPSHREEGPDGWTAFETLSTAACDWVDRQRTQRVLAALLSPARKEADPPTAEPGPNPADDAVRHGDSGGSAAGPYDRAGGVFKKYSAALAARAAELARNAAGTGLLENTARSLTEAEAARAPQKAIDARRLTDAAATARALVSEAGGCGGPGTPPPGKKKRAAGAQGKAQGKAHAASLAARVSVLNPKVDPAAEGEKKKMLHLKTNPRDLCLPRVTRDSLKRAARPPVLFPLAPCEMVRKQALRPEGPDFSGFLCYPAKPSPKQSFAKPGSQPRATPRAMAMMLPVIDERPQEDTAWYPLLTGDVARFQKAVVDLDLEYLVGPFAEASEQPGEAAEESFFVKTAPSVDPDPGPGEPPADPLGVGHPILGSQLQAADESTGKRKREAALLLQEQLRQSIQKIVSVNRRFSISKISSIVDSLFEKQRKASLDAVYALAKEDRTATVTPQVVFTAVVHHVHHNNLKAQENKEGLRMMEFSTTSEGLEVVNSRSPSGPTKPEP
ncbi:hypothetical protein DIPPA_15713 [Diplonema papillatum]|nr:hypothetical protein DIPPA_15713 [Diplonema papillatum]